MSSTPPTNKDQRSPTTRAARMTYSDVDLAQLLSRLGQNDAPRWMVAKQGLEHGPFTNRDVVSRILHGDIEEDHLIRSMEASQMTRVGDVEFFAPFIAQYQMRKENAKLASAVKRSKLKEYIMRSFKLSFGAMALVAIVAGMVWFVASRKKAREQAALEADFDGLFKSSAVILDPREFQQRARGHGKRGKGGKGGQADESDSSGSFEHAMNQAVNMGDVSAGGGEAVLTAEQISHAVDPQLGRLMPCVRKENAGGGSVNRVSIDIAIAGSGNVVGLSVRDGSPEFRKCVAGHLKQIHFPRFSAPRMATRYAFEVGG